MSLKTAIVELNDSEVRVGMEGRVSVASPGFAIIGDGGLVLGDDARRQARLRPREANNRFWSRLSLDPLENASELARHNADLAYAHLRQVHEQAGSPPEVIFAIPGIFTREQLSLLLGLAKACAFAPVGLVDSSVAALANTATPGVHVYIDVDFHQAVITELDVADEVVRTRVESVAGAGINAVLDVWAAAATDAFIQQHRFDPLQRAATEQSLYDRFAEVFQHPLRDKFVLEIEGNRVELSVGRLLQAAQSLYARIAERVTRIVAERGADGAIYLSHRAAALPGLPENFTDPRRVPPDAVIYGCENHEQFIRSNGEALQFVTRLPAMPGSAMGEAPPTTVRVADAPTHIVCGSRAYPVGMARLFAHREAHDGVGVGSQPAPGTFAAFSQTPRGIEVEAVDGHPLSCNGERVAGARVLKVGDVLRLSESKASLTVIQVVDEI